MPGTRSWGRAARERASGHGHKDTASRGHGNRDTASRGHGRFPRHRAAVAPGPAIAGEGEAFPVQEPGWLARAALTPMDSAVEPAAAPSPTHANRRGLHRHPFS